MTKLAKHAPLHVRLPNTTSDGAGVISNIVPEDCNRVDTRNKILLDK